MSNEKRYTFDGPHGYKIHVVFRQTKYDTIYIGYSITSPLETKETIRKIGFNIAEGRIDKLAKMENPPATIIESVPVHIGGPDYKPYKGNKLSKELRAVKWTVETAIRMLISGYSFGADKLVITQ